MRLIDADALKAEWYRLNDINEEDCGARFVGYQEIARLINNAPTVEPTGDLISRADAIKAVLGLAQLNGRVPTDSVIFQIKAQPSADAVKVAYICDGRKCDKDCSECFRTLDIEHARDFKLLGDTYYQQESADAEQGEWVIRENGNKECSVCGHERQDGWDYFCGYCGARMKGGAE